MDARIQSCMGLEFYTGLKAQGQWFLIFGQSTYEVWRSCVIQSDKYLTNLLSGEELAHNKNGVMGNMRFFCNPMGFLLRLLFSVVLWYNNCCCTIGL